MKCPLDFNSKVVLQDAVSHGKFNTAVKVSGEANRVCTVEVKAGHLWQEKVTEVVCIAAGPQQVGQGHGGQP